MCSGNISSFSSSLRTIPSDLSLPQTRRRNRSRSGPELAVWGGGGGREGGKGEGEREGGGREEGGRREGGGREKEGEGGREGRREGGKESEGGREREVNRMRREREKVTVYLLVSRYLHKLFMVLTVAAGAWRVQGQAERQHSLQTLYTPTQ